MGPRAPVGGGRVARWWRLAAPLLLAAVVLPAVPAAASGDCQGLEPTVSGTDDRDVLIGTPGSDVIDGRGGRDLIVGGAGGDVICAGDGDDRIIGGSGDDSIEGGDGGDTLLGGSGRDFLDGGDGDDNLSGGGDGDFLDGGDGRDRLVGGPSFDHCRLGESLRSCEGEGFTSYGPGDDIAIGLAFVTDEPVGFLGIDQTRGVELAVLERSGRVLGREVTLVSANSGCQPEVAEAAAEAVLAARPDVVAVLGTSCSGTASAANAVLAPAEVFMVSPSASAPSLTDPVLGLDFFARTVWNDRDQATVMAGFATGDLELTRAAVVAADDSYSHILADTFAAEFTDAGGTVVFEGMAPTLAGDFDALLDDMASFLAGIAATDAEFVFAPLFPPESLALTIAAHTAPGLDDVALSFTDGSFFPEFLTFAGEAAEGVYFVVPDTLGFTESVPYQERFLTPFLAEYGTPPATPFAATSFDAATMVLAAIEQAGAGIGGTAHLSLPGFRAALGATSGLDGVTGTISCDAFGDCGAVGMTIFQVEDGAFVPR